MILYSNVIFEITKIRELFAVIILMILSFAFNSCASFSDLPLNNKNTKDIFGVYQNDPVSSPFRSRSLWSYIQPKYYIEEEGLLVKFELVEDDFLQATLIDNDSVISSKIIKGKFKDDNCYYKRRTFYIIPILPILWAFENEQFRLYNTPESIVLEYTFNRGGAVIIMAGGDKGNDANEYRKVY